MNIRYALLAVSLLLCSCQNPYTQFYTNVITPDTTAQLYPYSGRTDYVSAPEKDFELAARKLGSQSYACLGYASFEANAQDYGPQLRAKAKELGADVVLVSTSFAGTLSGVMPLLNYQPGHTSSTYTSGQVNANVYTNRGTSAYGTANYSGQSTTSSPGTFTTSYVPYSVSRNTYTASFWRKRNHIFGAMFLPLSPEQRQALQRNTGLVVVVLAEGSPAFLANILPEDILLTIDGEEITTTDSFIAQLKARTGLPAKIGVLRAGTTKLIDVRMGKMIGQ